MSLNILLFCNLNTVYKLDCHIHSWQFNISILILILNVTGLKYLCNNTIQKYYYIGLPDQCIETFKTKLKSSNSYLHTLFFCMKCDRNKITIQFSHFRKDASMG